MGDFFGFDHTVHHDAAANAVAIALYQDVPHYAGPVLNLKSATYRGCLSNKARTNGRGPDA